MTLKISHYFKLITLIFVLSSSKMVLFGQIAKTQVVQLQANVINDKITLKWPKENYTGKFMIYSRNFGEINYTKIAEVAGTINTYTESANVSSKEYLVSKISSTGSTDALGYIFAGNKYNVPLQKGGVVLLIDSSYISALSNEISTLKQDLINSGWNVYIMYAGRKENVKAVKTRIQKLVDAKTPRPKTLYIIGHVPVPYSGYFSNSGDRPPPDGHVEGSGNHTGAWPADCYYGDFEGIWSDNAVNCTTGSATRHHNIPKDGKFDQSVPPAKIELEIGRLDMFDMSAFSNNDTQLTREYLNRVHLFRMGEINFTKRALIDNNFTGLNLASTGYQNLPCFVGLDSVSDTKDYFTEQNSGSYLWSYGCGAGSYNSCSGIGTSNDFSANKGVFSNAFTMLAGSFFGDYDSKNNLMKAALAAGSFNVCWGGIPKWYLHHMALGLNSGFGAKLTINNDADYFNGAFNGSWNGVFIELLGDPTLTMNHVKPPTNLTAQSTNGNVLLKWNKSADAESYNIYRIDTSNNSITLARTSCGTSSNTTDTFFTDDCNWTSGKYTYAVAAVKLETTGAGTYVNQSMLVNAQIQHVNGLNKMELSKVSISPNPIENQFIIRGLNSNKPVQIEVLNIIGQPLFVFEGQKPDANGMVTIDNKFNFNGLAIIKLNQNGESISFPVVFNHKN